MGRAARFAPEVGAFFAGCARVVGNLEGIVTGERWLPFLQRHSVDVFDALAAVAPADRWVLGVANNHAPDYGDAGLDATVRAIEDAGMSAVGTVERPRIELAPRVELTAWTEWTNGFTARVPTRDPGPSGASWLQIAFPHWGYEFERTPRPGARAALPAGYDVVVGHHSHVPQAVEIVDGRLVAWSLGNFCTDVPLATMGEGALLKLGLATRAAGAPRVVVARTVPLRIDRRDARTCAVAVAA
jgi:poly-gamma-glutamate capsule biosynthesis protein CapA/YwtB (metallophosphatase superfamily)